MRSSVPGTTPAKSWVPPSTASPIASSSRSVSRREIERDAGRAGPAQQRERHVGCAGVHDHRPPSLTATTSRSSVLDDLPVDGPVGAVAAGRPDLPAQHGGEGRLVELQHRPARPAPGGAPRRDARTAPPRARPRGRGGRPRRPSAASPPRSSSPAASVQGPTAWTFSGPSYPWVNSSSASRSSPSQERARRVSRPGRSLTRQPLGSTCAYMLDEQPDGPPQHVGARPARGQFGQIRKFLERPGHRLGSLSRVAARHRTDSGGRAPAELALLAHPRRVRERRAVRSGAPRPLSVTGSSMASELVQTGHRSPQRAGLLDRFVRT